MDWKMNKIYYSNQRLWFISNTFYISDINVSFPNIDFENVSNDIKTLKLTLCDNYPLR